MLATLFGATPASAQLTSVEGTVVTESRRLSEMVVYLVSDEQPLEPAADETPFIDQINLTFVPSVLTIAPGTTVDFRNSDPLLHNVFSPGRPGPGFDLGTYPKTETRSHTFREIGAHVILCHVHPDMYAFVIVVPTPFRTTVDEDGHFRIDGVPGGRYTVRVWHRQEYELTPQLIVRAGGTPQLTVDLSSGELEVRGGD
jgi:plastocyanin